ncbi:sensor histidine kinase [Shewanella seohaensis]|uniref:histidine kinase n=1 Tax=Shewanella seohaensis TaxID=755175 RepID=A0ABV4VZL5_9GAMM
MQFPQLSLKRRYQQWGIFFLLVTLGVNIFIPLCMMCAGMNSMNEIVMSNIGQFSELILREGESNSRMVDKTIIKTDNFTVYYEWNDVPSEVKKISKNVVPEKQSEIFYQHVDGSYVDALSVYYTKDGSPLYILLHYSVTHELQIAPKNMTAILLLVFITFCASASLAFYMQNKVITPIHKISRAIKEHSWQGDDTLTLPKQKYAELKSIVEALENSIFKLNEHQKGELDFLRFLSHELRTPVAICQSSFEVISLQQGKLTGPMLFASQATNQMKSTIETLLWLTNKKSAALEMEFVNLGDLIDRVVSEHVEIFGCDIVVSLERDDTCLYLIREPLTIIISNLIRNSFEHGGQAVSIIQKNCVIEIINPVSENNYAGFGLGLTLVRRLVTQLGWEFSTLEKDNQFYVKLNICT